MYFYYVHVYLFMHLYVTYIVHSAVDKDVSSVNLNKQCLTKKIKNHIFLQHTCNFLLNGLKNKRLRTDREVDTIMQLVFSKVIYPAGQ